MNEKWQGLLQKLKNPPVWLLVLTYVLTVASATGALLILLVDYEGTFLAVVAYALFGLAAISLSYTVYTLVLFAPKMRRAIIDWAEKYEFTYSLLRNYGFRTIILTIGSFAMSVAYGVFNGVLGVIGRSVWYGALSAYYIFLAFLRGGVLLYHRRKKKNEGELDNDLVRAKTYRNCGVLLLVLNVALSSAIAQMIFDEQSFSYGGWTIYAFAAYAFYKITMSIVNLVRARKQNDLTVQAVRNVNLVDGAVSILALQTALLNTFVEEGTNISLFNTLTGSAISLFAVGLSIFMIVKANKRMKQLQTENTNGEQRI